MIDIEFFAEFMKHCTNNGLKSPKDISTEINRIINENNAIIAEADELRIKNSKLKEILRTRPPRAVKLDKVAIDENSVDSNGYYAIKCAQTSSSASALI